MNLESKTIVIIGGAGLLGRAFSRSCREAGAHVIIVDADKTGTAFAREIGADFIAADVTKDASVAALMKTLARKYPRIDGCVYAAYPRTKQYGTPITETTPKDIRENITLQLTSALLVIRALMPRIENNGSIILLGSIYGVAAPRFDIYKGTDMTMPVEYAAVKGGIIALTRFFASFLGDRGIRVNTVSPGGITNKQPASFIKAYEKKTLLKSGLLSPNDIAGTVVFLLSDASKRMTGQNLIVDGGWTL